jgi:hypothetical protein
MIFKDHFQVIGQPSCTHKPATKDVINMATKNIMRTRGMEILLGQIHRTADVSVCSAKYLLRRAAIAG